MKPVRILPPAEAELSDAAAFYEGRRQHLGMEFLEAVASALDRIAAMPDTFPIWRAGRSYRQLRLKRFPFVIFFRDLEAEVEVVAVAHSKRRPGYWVSR